MMVAHQMIKTNNKYIIYMYKINLISLLYYYNYHILISSISVNTHCLFYIKHEANCWNETLADIEIFGNFNNYVY